MKSTILLFIASLAVATSLTCTTMELNTNCCQVSPDQPKGFHGSVAMNYICKGCNVFGDFNQTYVQAYGSAADSTEGAAMYVGAKRGGFGVFSQVAGMKDVSRYHYRSIDGKCTSTAVMPADGTSFPVSFCYESDIEDCRFG